MSGEKRSQEMVVLGEIVRSQGRGGELRVFPSIGGICYSALKEMFVVTQAERGESFHRVDSLRVMKKFLVIRVNDFSTLEDAQKLIGAQLVAFKKDFPKLPDESYYWFEIEGLKALNEEGNLLGVVTMMFSTGSNDVWVIAQEGREILIPALDDVVKEINLQEGTLLLHIPEGLIDGN